MEIGIRTIHVASWVLNNQKNEVQPLGSTNSKRDIVIATTCPRVTHAPDASRQPTLQVAHAEN